MPAHNPMDQKQQQDQRIENNLKQITHRIVVFSGKGGVGKTTVAVNLAYSLLKQNNRTGLLDADITGPNVPIMTGLEGFPETDPEAKTITPQEKDGLQIISMAPMMPKDQPVIWRGPLRSSAITQFLSDVLWGELDFLLADLPPGTGDEVLTTAQRMMPQMAIVVTTPQEVSLLDCRRAVNMARKLNIEKIGVIENMSGLVCPHCGKEIDFFGNGGGKKMAGEMGVAFLGSVPMEIATRNAGDNGRPIVLSNPESSTGKAFAGIAANVITMVS
ncbi:Mrp/NBP35 family ATP-binding protein [bacterium]|nr:Mrp/NBP35 family ATP-binding protein [bacterium]